MSRDSHPQTIAQRAFDEEVHSFPTLTPPTPFCSGTTHRSDCSTFLRNLMKINSRCWKMRWRRRRCRELELRPAPLMRADPRARNAGLKVNCYQMFNLTTLLIKWNDQPPAVIDSSYKEHIFTKGVIIALCDSKFRSSTYLSFKSWLLTSLYLKRRARGAERRRTPCSEDADMMDSSSYASLFWIVRQHWRASWWNANWLRCESEYEPIRVSHLRQRDPLSPRSATVSMAQSQ